MGLFDFFRAANRSAEAARVEPALTATSESVQSETQWNGFKLPGGISRAGVRVDEKRALTIPAAMQALRILTGVFAMTPMIYYRDTPNGRVRADDDPLYELFKVAPNGHHTAYAFKELLLGDLLLKGNFFSFVSRDPRMQVRALTRLKPGNVQIAEFFDRSEGTTLFYDATLPNGDRERFASRDLWHVSGFTRDGISGLNPIDFARDALGGAIATADHATRFWGNGGRPSTVLTAKGKVPPEAKGQMRADWRARYGGPNGDDIAVLDQDVTATFLAHDNQASQFLETRGFQILDIARIWGVPPHLLFDLSRATFSNIEHQSLEFVTYHLGPHYTRVAEAATRAFAAPGHYFEFLTDALVRGDLKSRMDAYWLQRQMGIVNANELRRRENERDIDGDAGTEYWRPANMSLGGTPPTPARAVEVAPAQP